MSRVLISGYYGFGNAGDEAILAGLIRSLRELDPVIKITVVSGTAAETRRLHDVAAVSRNQPRAIWAAVGAADLVLLGGGSLLQDVTGFKSIPYYLGIILMGLVRGKATMFCAHGVGPIHGTLGRVLVRLIGNRVDAITVRDPESAAVLRRLGVRRPSLAITADAALSLPPGEPDRGRATLAALGAPPEAPVIGVSVRAWRNGALPALAQALDRLTDDLGAQILFIPMQPGQDLDVIRHVQGHMQASALLLPEPYDYERLLDVVAACNLVIGVRYHALVFAAMSGVPLVGLTYDPKNDNFLRSIGMKAAGTVARLEPDALVAAARQALSRTAGERKRLRVTVAQLAQRSRENARLALDLLRRRG